MHTKNGCVVLSVKNNTFYQELLTFDHLSTERWTWCLKSCCFWVTHLVSHQWHTHFENVEVKFRHIWIIHKKSYHSNIFITLSNILNSFKLLNKKITQYTILKLVPSKVKKYHTIILNIEIIQVPKTKIY